MLVIPGEYLNPVYSDGHPYEVELAHVGQGNWRAFRTIGFSLSDFLEIARGWAAEFSGIDRPWLCWNVDDEWSVVQQRLVASIGWTPVVGFDPRVGPPRQIARGAVIVDFNRELGLPVLYPHFPIEFVFLFCKKMAFWHSDLLVRDRKLRQVAALFEGLEDGQTVATSGWAGWRTAFSTRKKRYCEVIGCTTARASRDQFEKGCGWWMDYWAHPNQKQGEWIKPRYYWDHGAGIYYWHRHEKGDCKVLPERWFREGHFTKLRIRNYPRFREPSAWSDARRLMASEIRGNFDLVQACKALGLERFSGTSGV